MLHTKFQVHRPFVSREDFESFLACMGMAATYTHTYGRQRLTYHLRWAENTECQADGLRRGVNWPRIEVKDWSGQSKCASWLRSKRSRCELTINRNNKNYTCNNNYNNFISRGQHIWHGCQSNISAGYRAVLTKLFSGENGREDQICACIILNSGRSSFLSVPLLNHWVRQTHQKDLGGTELWTLILLL